MISQIQWPLQSNAKDSEQDFEEDEKGSASLIGQAEDLQSLIELQLNVQYQIDLAETQTKFYKMKLAQKDAEIQKLKEKAAKKNSKIKHIADHIKSVESKIKQINEGYKRMLEERNQLHRNQSEQRTARLSAQEEKGNLYKRYCDLSQQYYDILEEIKSYDEIETEAIQLEEQNKLLKIRIEELQLKRKANHGGQNDKKGSLKNQMKKMYEHSKELQKQQTEIAEKYEEARQKIAHFKQIQNVNKNRSKYINDLYLKIDQIKAQIARKRSDKIQKERLLKDYSTEEKSLRNEILVEQQYQQAQHKYHQKASQSFKIIDSEADEFPQAQSLKTPQDKMADMINKFERIKAGQRDNK